MIAGVGLISSISIHGITHSVQNWPLMAGETVPCELYCFMTSDLRGGALSDIGSASESKTAVEFMTRHARDEGVIIETAEALRSAFLSQGNEIAVVSIASFVPENAFRGPGQLRDYGCGAILFLLRLADMMRQMELGSIETIELVGGSRMASVWPGIREGNQAFERGQRAYYASRMSDENAMRQVLDCVGQAFAEYTELSPSLTRLAFELEPGPLYVLRDDATLMSFLCEIRGHDVLKDWLFRFWVWVSGVFLLRQWGVS